MIDLLVIDDDKRVHQAIDLILSGHPRDYRIKHTFDGEEGVLAASQYPYNLCITDFEMPKKNGLAVAKEIHSPKNIQGGYMPIIMASSYRFDAGEIEVLSPYVDDFLEKPFDVNNFMNKINQWYLTIDVLRERNDKTTYIIKERPMDQKEAAEIRALKERGLVKFKIYHKDAYFVAHENIQNKIVHDFTVAGQPVSTFIDQDPREPGPVNVYRDSHHIDKIIVPIDDLKEEIEKEKKLLDREIYQKKQ